MSQSYPKKLIEVALPLPEINDASAYDKMPGIGPHPKGIHQWWARLPLPAARAILFASAVDDPECYPEKWSTDGEQRLERERLFEIMRRMMRKKLHENLEVYAEAREEIVKSCGNNLPMVFDPFAGGGSIPLEANRLGFRVYAGDLNPLAVLLNKCNLELVPPWINHEPVNPRDHKKIGGRQGWLGTHGLAADVRYYSGLINDRALSKIGHLYPKAHLAKEQGNEEANVIAWIWVRTVASPNPAALGKHVPLTSTFWLSSKKDKEIWLEPEIDKSKNTYRFEVKNGTPRDRLKISAGTKNKKGGFRCLLTDAPIPFSYIRSEGNKGKLGFEMVAIVVDGKRGRFYLNAHPEQVAIAESASPSEFPDTDLPESALGFRVQNYGIRKHWQLFTPRQVTGLVTLSDLIKEIREEVIRDASEFGLKIRDANSYSDTITTFLALALDRCCDFNNVLCVWTASNQKVMHLFTRQALPMVWDFGEANLLGESVGSWSACSDYIADCLEVIPGGFNKIGKAEQIDAANGFKGATNLLISTDPPYYDNIGYAALSDFFYVWLRRTIGHIFPEIFSTVLVPKLPELIASPERFNGDKQKAKEHFESGFRKSFSAIREQMDSRFPLTIYYAFKQDDTETGSPENKNKKGEIDLTTGWETLLQALVSSGFQITATWPIRASQAWRMRAVDSNALASYIVLACRPRNTDAQQCGRREFLNELRWILPESLRRLQQGNVAPVDFAQAAIGPGMSIYSKYARILEPSGEAMTVRIALGLINQMLTEVLSAREDEFDNETRWALAWFEQNGFAEGEFGEAEVLSKAKVTSVPGMMRTGILSSKGGKVRLLPPNELPSGWDPTAERHSIWEMTHHLIRIYHIEQKGEMTTAEFLRMLGSAGEAARDLAYQLFAICEKKKYSQEAQGYNALVLAWPELTRLVQEIRTGRPEQTQMF